MHAKINDLVYPVLSYGLVLKERLERGDPLNIADEQGRLVGLLQSDTEARRLPEYGGDGAYLGIRYALVCWLDEVFILHSTWGREWNENKLETALYGTNNRAEKFWSQAKLARSRPGSDSFEAFFLCVMLGFRGAAREDLDGLRTWVNEAKTQIAKSGVSEWTAPPQGNLPSDIQPLRGRNKFRRMLITAGATLLVLACIGGAYGMLHAL